MASQEHHRSVSLRRTGEGALVATNTRGGELALGTGEGGRFTPVELLLAAIGGCTALDVDALTSRLAEPDRFELVVGAEKVRDAGGNRLQDITLTFHVTFPEGESGDAARERLPDAAARSHDRLCTVSRTVELGTPVSWTLSGDA
ncbi:MAG TPA: OsmC family protein [Oryzihumus sp.]|nr:OsmC family protein [Oryzihumus sp.]